MLFKHLVIVNLYNRSQIERLPTINQSLQDFTKLEPTSNGLNIGGRSSQYNNMTVDGANFNNSFVLSSVLGSQTGSQPISLDAIEQIQVNGFTLRCNTRWIYRRRHQLGNPQRDQQNYLSAHRGEFAKANGWVLPWYKKLDLNITQDIYFYSKNKGDNDKHTIRLSLDIINVGNFVNKNWGLVKTPTLNSNSSGYQLLTFEGMAADNRTPLYSFPYADASSQTPRTNSYNNSTGITSRWQMQFGIRYLFN